jgi:hypothetical protein
VPETLSLLVLDQLLALAPYASPVCQSGDASLQKSFPIFAKWNLIFRIDAFNLTGGRIGAERLLCSVREPLQRCSIEDTRTKLSRGRNL